MFEGVADQFHQFIASSRTTTTTSSSSSPTLPLPISFPPLHASTTTNTFPTFDSYPSSHSQHHVVPLQPNFLHPLHPQSVPVPVPVPAGSAQKIEEKDQDQDQNNLVGINLEIIEKERSIPAPELPSTIIDPSWSNDEVLALLRIRSSMENWFPDFTWEHISRKLAELGFKRSAEKCKEKFEEESRYFNNVNYNNKNYRIFSELEDLYHGDDHQNPHQLSAQKNKNMEKPNQEEDKIMGQINLDHQQDSRNNIIIDHQTVGNPSDHQEYYNQKVAAGEKSRIKKRKREKKFEMFKGFCEDIISKMMAQQEEMQKKLLEDMVKRDEEKVAREENWKKQEMDRINKELEIRAQEQAISGDRQSTIINFLKKFTYSSSSSSSEIQCFKVLKSSNLDHPPITSSNSLIQIQNPSSTPTPSCHSNNQSKFDHDHQVLLPTSSTMILSHQNSASLSNQNNPNIPSSLTEKIAPQNPSSTSSLDTTTTPKLSTSSALALAPQNSSFLNTQKNLVTPTSFSIQKVLHKGQNPTSNDQKEDLGKRWPREEVLALINLRCSLYNNGEDKEITTAKAPLWERISQGMLELGYKRSAKRCKEKWENINKYFRKTKDVNRKRSLDSRTCPYFHQLSTLYNQGTRVAAPSERPETRSAMALPENRLDLPETLTPDQPCSQGGSSVPTLLHVVEGEKNSVQVPAACDFEF